MALSPQNDPDTKSWKEGARWKEGRKRGLSLRWGIKGLSNKKKKSGGEEESEGPNGSKKNKKMEN